MKKNIYALIISILILTSWSTNAALIRDVSSDGILLGAKNVDVNGVLYDVVFVDGSCIEVFDGCDEENDFTFLDENLAYEAAEALSSQVFIDGVDGLFDSDPSLTFGCGSDLACFVFTPFIWRSDSIVTRYFGNSNSEFEDTVSHIAMNFDYDLSYMDNYRVFAKWKAVEVPAPSVLGVFLVALFVLVVQRRR